MAQVKRTEHVPKEVQDLKERVLSALMEVRSEDGIIPIGLLKKHVALENPWLFQVILRELEDERLIGFAYGEGYERGVRLKLRAASDRR